MNTTVTPSEQSRLERLSVDDLLAAGLAHHQAGRLTEAELHYQRLLTAPDDPRQANALYYLGMIAYQRDRPAVAIEFIDQAIQRDGTNPAYHTVRGVVLLDLGHPEEALKCQDQAVALDPDNVDILSNRGLVLERLGRFEEALECYDQALAVRPDFVAALVNRGNALQRLQRFDEALAERNDEYLSCEWAEGGLAFNRRSIHACLIVHHETGYPFLADHNGGPLPIDRILRIRGEIQKANQAGKIHPECRGCAHLKRKRWPPSPYPINIVGIAHYSHCNIACNYCFLQTQDPSSFESGYRPYSILETFRELYARGILAPDAIIDWGGGEPTVYREFEDILALTLEAGAFHYLHSNCVKLPGAIRNTAYAGRIHVICSVDAGLPETYKLLKKRDYLEVVWGNLAEYIRIGCRVTIKYIVREDNCSAANLEAFVARAAEIDAKKFIIDVDYNYPDPVPKVITAAARLQYLASRARIHTRFGFTGSNFAAENDLGSRVQSAFEGEQLRAIREFLGERGYAVSSCADQTVEELYQSVRELEKSCTKKNSRCGDLKPSFTKKSLICRSCPASPHLIRRLLAQWVAIWPWKLFSRRG